MVSIGRKLRCNGIKHLQDRTEALGGGHGGETQLPAT